jgi:hypothetical protein
MHALLTIWSASVSPPFITVKIGDRQDALTCVARLILLQILIGIEWLALTPGPFVFAGFAPDVLPISVASVVMKIVPGTIEFALRTNLHSGSELPF